MTEPTLRLRLRQIREEAQDICSFEFVSADGRDLPTFDAGAHIDLQLTQGRVRSYSIASAPGCRTKYLVAVQREADGRGGSVWMHDSLRVGQEMSASAPSNDFHLDEEANDSILIAGGIGITPILSMIERLDAIGRPWQLFYASRTPASMAFRERLSELDRGRGLVTYCIGGAGPERLDVERIVSKAPASTHLYCCGPARMIDAFVSAGQARDPATIHFERFSASEAAAMDGGYSVRLARSERVVPVMQGQTLLDALLDANVPVAYACSSGICGTCQTGVISGVPDHRDEFLSDEEKRLGKTMIICCSGSKSPELVLDL